MHEIEAVCFLWYGQAACTTRNRLHELLSFQISASCCFESPNSFNRTPAFSMRER